VLSTTVTFGGCGGSGDESAKPRPPDVPALQRTLRTLTQTQHSGALALVRAQTGTWRGASGYAEGTRRVRPGNRFPIASTTKPFVATVVLQLVGERRLALNDSVEARLPGKVRAGDRITLRQLLNHTSGLKDPGFSSELAPRDFQPALLFQPGTSHSYANINYVILGLIVEKTTGRALDQVVRDRIFQPLGLTNTSYGTAALPSRGKPPAWLGTPDDPAPVVRGDGGIVSTADDLARFLRALLGGELLRPELLTEMTRTIKYPAPEPELRGALGLFRARLPCGDAWGHIGASSYSNAAFSARDGSKIVVVAQNTPDFTSVKDAAEKLYCQQD
jgi:D-alanyl-D-alanine carboxypeptidase